MTALSKNSRSEHMFHGAVRIIAFTVLALLAGIVIVLYIDARPAITRYGFGFLFSSDWDPVFERFGAAPFIFGTIVTSLLALLLAVPFAIGGALYIAEYAPKRIGTILSFLIELLVAIPSVGYGLWGLFVLVPFMRTIIDPVLRTVIGPIPLIGELFRGPTIGQDILTASVILAIMILPTILAIAREIIVQVPKLQREGMYALGATHWEMVRKAIIPYATPGIIGAALLGLARAVGETMAVTMVIGNSSSTISASLFNPGYTIASAIANQFTEADTRIYFAAVVELGLILLAISAMLYIVARLIVQYAGNGKKLSLHFLERTKEFAATEADEDSLFLLRDHREKLSSRILLALTMCSVTVLFLIVGYTAVQGLSGINFAFFTQTPKPMGHEGGGIVQAILGSLEMLGVGILIALPFGLGTAIYLSEYGKGKVAKLITFTIELLASLPSIVIGIVIWAVVVRSITGFSGIAGAISLAIIMTPIMARSIQEILHLVPKALREAGIALGADQWMVIWKIVIPTVLPGIFTSIVLAVARAAGETAPLMLTALGNEFIQTNLGKPMAAMTLQIYNYAMSPYQDWHRKAWAAMFVLILVIAVFSFSVRISTRRLRHAER